MADNKEMEIEYDEDENDIGNVFWTLKIPVGKETDIPQPPIPGFIIRITSATFGENVKSNSRTVVNCIQETEQGTISSPICILRDATCETFPLDLLFSEAVSFKLSGRKPSEVTLNGYLQPPSETPLDAGALEDLEEARIEEELRNRKRKRNDEEEENENESNDDEINITKGEDNNEENSDDNNEDNEPESEEETKPEPVIKKRKLNDDKIEGKKKSNNKNEKKDKKGKKEMKTLKNGLKIKDMREGKGKEIKVGNTVTCRYVGQLSDKSVFDKAISGPGFSFIFGKGEVIKGWDIGMKGMKVGGKRRLIIPPKLGYGREGSEPSIPPNAILTFTIEVTKCQ